MIQTSGLYIYRPLVGCAGLHQAICLQTRIHLHHACDLNVQLLKLGQREIAHCADFGLCLWHDIAQFTAKTVLCHHHRRGFSIRRRADVGVKMQLFGIQIQRQFLVYLSQQSLFRRFTRIDFAARQIPSLLVVAVSQEQRPMANNDEACGGQCIQVIPISVL